MQKAAEREKKSVWDIADFYIKAFVKDWQILNLKEPMVRPRATEYVNEMIEHIQKLIEKGFERIEDRESELVNLVRSMLIRYIDHVERSARPEKLSVFISNHTSYNYSYLSKVFSDQTGITIETCLIRLKIERVKELLDFRKWTLSEIAWKLKYSSVQYLSNQFKKVTGQTVTEYLRANISGRKALDQI